MINIKTLFNKKNKILLRNMIPWFLFIISFFVILFLSVRLDSIKKNPNQIADYDIKTMVNRVGELMVLPKDELPTIATITDLKALKEAYKGELFFANAKVGDKILIYVKSGVAILYDPIANKIVESGPIDRR